MTVKLGRLEATTRLFPEISRDFHKRLLEESDFLLLPSGTSLAAFGIFRDPFPLRRWGYPADPAAALGRILACHRRAFEVELEGNLESADYYWDETIRLLEAGFALNIPKDASRAGRNERERDVRTLTANVVEEVLVDTHCAFFNGFAGSAARPDPDNRAFRHLAWLERIILIAGLDRKAFASILEVGMWLRIEALAHVKRHDEAIRLAEALAHAHGGEEAYAEILIEVLSQSAFDGLSLGKTEKDRMADVERLEKHCGQAAKQRDLHPGLSAGYSLVGALQHALAWRYASTSRIPEALEAIRKALANSLGNREYLQSEAELDEAMKSLQEKMRQVENQIARDPGLRIADSAVGLVRQANTGFLLANAWLKSEEAAELRMRSRRASNRRMWRLLGLGEYDDSQSGFLHKVSLAISEALDRCADDPSRLAETWKEVSSESPELAYVPLEGIHVLLSKPSPPAFPGRTCGGEGPCIEISAPPLSHGWGGRHLADWIYGRADRGIKATAVAAILAIFAASGLSLREIWIRKVRTDAFSALQSALRQSDMDPVLDAAEKFTRHTPLAREDDRDSVVAWAYEMALVKAFTRASAELSAKDLERIRTFGRWAGVRAEE